MFKNLRYDLPAALVVFLVALPLCLGIALASGAPLFSGLIAGIVGGLVIGSLSRSPLSVSGPAAGLTVIVLEAINSLPSFEAFLLAVSLAGVLQLGFGLVRAGTLGDFIPTSVIKGMLAAIGLILIMKQFPHAVGYDADFEGDEAFTEAAGANTFSTLFSMMGNVLPAAIVISSISLVFMFWWDKKQAKIKNWLRYMPGPLAVVLFGVLANELIMVMAPEHAIMSSHLVAVPVAESLQGFFGQFNFPDLGQIGNKQIWITAVTLALVASIETLLCIEALDKLDPFRRVTPTNRELMAQGAGNIVSGMIGGLPITSVIVRSSANVTAGGRTRMSTIVHGALLLVCVATIPALLNRIPLASLAAILIAVGYKLTKPSIFREKYQKGWSYLVPFVVTIVTILFTDLLIGIGVGVVVALGFLLAQNTRAAISCVADGSNYLLRCKKDLYFIHKYELKQKLSRIPNGSSVLLDLSQIHFVDRDNIDIITDFITNASYRNIRITIKEDAEHKVGELMEVLKNEAA